LNRAEREACILHLHTHAFGTGVRSLRPPAIGAEIELIPVDPETRRIASVNRPGMPSTRAALCAAARRAGWTHHTSAKTGQTEFRTSVGGRITFEPGGQIEYASPPLPSVTLLLADLRRTVDLICGALNEAGLEAVFSGIDPVNPIEDVPLQVDAPRYRRMDAHFASIGPHGARMMRQTASVQVNVDLGHDPLDRWRLLCALAPYLAAMFANAPAYGGRPAEEASVRRQAWNRLDPARTGLPFDGARPVEAYADFALGAAAILGSVDRPPFPAFGDLPFPGFDGWEAHLSTMFPEVRPRGYFEVRSIDALDPSWLAAPLVMVAGLTLDDRVARDAAEVAGDPDPSLLEAAGRLALADPRLARGAGELAHLAVRGAESLGTCIVGSAAVEEARDYFTRFTWAGRVPADAASLPVG
jgi:glutamate--cysteine ligase